MYRGKSSNNLYLPHAGAHGSKRSLLYQFRGMAEAGPMDANTREAMMTVMQGGQPSSSNHQPNYEPSQTLRAAIVERLEAQKEALEEAVSTLEHLIATGKAGADDHSRTPGNQQISGQDLAAVREHAKAEGILEDHHVAQGSSRLHRGERSSRMLPRSAPWQVGMSREEFENAQSSGDEDPISQYRQLEREITALVQRGSGQQDQRNPYQSLPGVYAAPAHPRTTQRERIEKLLGSGNGMRGSQRGGGSFRGRSAQPSPYMGQQQSVQGDQMPSARNINEAGRAGSMRSGGMGSQYSG